MIDAFLTELTLFATTAWKMGGVPGLGGLESMEKVEGKNTMRSVPGFSAASVGLQQPSNAATAKIYVPHADIP